ncbi:MAG TPA: T9SS type A sorting domain-containing protein, partial [Chitinophagaceae bacterium]|nr:T9SS type A sorting domain-containing protein [Chitinophagaceae bacterium]
GVGIQPAHKIPAEKITRKEELIDPIDTVTFSPAVVVRKETIFSLIKEESAVKRSIEATKISTKVYPNPVKRGESVIVEIEGKTNEAIMIKLMATDGKTLIIHKRPISKGNNRFTISTDPAWTAGVYFLVFSNEKGILIKTEELLIQ